MVRMDPVTEIQRVEGGSFDRGKILVYDESFGFAAWRAIEAVERLGILVDAKFYLKILYVLKRTNVVTIELYPRTDALEIRYERGCIRLKGVTRMSEDETCEKCGSYSGGATLCPVCERKALKKKKKRKAPVKVKA